MTIYCPACGETWESTLFVVLAPGNSVEPVRCSGCGTEYRIQIQFFPVGEEPEKKGVAS